MNNNDRRSPNESLKEIVSLLLVKMSSFQKFNNPLSRSEFDSLLNRNFCYFAYVMQMKNLLGFLLTGVITRNFSNSQCKQSIKDLSFLQIPKVILWIWCKVSLFSFCASHICMSKNCLNKSQKYKHTSTVDAKN